MTGGARRGKNPERAGEGAPGTAARVRGGAPTPAPGEPNPVRLEGTRAARALAALALLAIGVAMARWTWGRWADPQIDFGGEIYAAWRLSEGGVLYRDVAYFTGPLSPYLNALWFELFGASLATLVWANLAVLTAIAALLHRLVARIAGPSAAFGAAAVFLALFAFAQLEQVGNSNYVTPYSHETTHGALIALGALNSLERWLATRALGWAAAVGALVGLSFLTKAEVFLAVLAASGAGLALGLVRRRERIGATALAFGASALVPVLAAFLLLAVPLDAGEAWRGTLGAWPYLADGRITSNVFYERIRGTDRPGANLAALARFAAIEGLAVALAAGLGFVARGVRSAAAGLVAAALVAGALYALPIEPRTWMQVARPWPLWAATCAALALLAWARARRVEPAASPDAAGLAGADRAALTLAFSLYALALLAKMVLNARIGMYGFALALPATVLVVAASLAWIPAWVGRRGGSAALARGSLGGLLLAGVIAHLAIMHGHVGRATVPLGSGRDALLADLRGVVLGQALAEVEQRTREGDTVVVRPEGVMLNYLARRATGVRYINYMPPELLMFGEDRIVADLAANPPDLVVWIAKSTREYGVPQFGRDYGARLWSWVTERYRPVWSLQDPRILLDRGFPFGAQVLAPK